MKPMQLTLIAALFSVVSASAALAADADSAAARQQRMDQALEDYRNAQPGPAARTENSIKRGAHRAGMAIKRGAESAGHAMGHGMRKAGEAMGPGGEKPQEASTPKP